MLGMMAFEFSPFSDIIIPKQWCGDEVAVLLGGADAADACGWRVRLPLGPGPGARIPSPYRPHQWGETGDTGDDGG